MSRTFYSAFLNFLYPPHCHICSKFIPDADSLHICKACMESLSPVVQPFCSVCGIPFAGAGENHCCSRCLLDSPAFDTARAPFVFEGGVKELLHSFKYTPRPHLRKPLALLISEALRVHVELIMPDLIMPVPLHSKKIRQRGFNQAILLGEVLSKQWKLPLERSVLQRTRWTEPQVNLTGDERRTNVRGAFAVSNERLLVDRKVLLLDDVFTTGSTLHECARAIKAVGASQVHAVTVARAV